MIYEWYVNGLNGDRMGISKIVRQLNLLGIPALNKTNLVPGTVSAALPTRLCLRMKTEKFQREEKGINGRYPTPAERKVVWNRQKVVRFVMGKKIPSYHHLFRVSSIHRLFQLNYGKKHKPFRSKLLPGLGQYHPSCQNLERDYPAPRRRK